jgi:NCAIR mutase (PurE)-related protein
MDIEKLYQLFNEVQEGQTSVDEAISRLRKLPFEDLGYARLDTHRTLRQGIPEVVYGENKTPEQLEGILAHLWEQHERVLATRVRPVAAESLRRAFPEGRYDGTSRLFTLARSERPAFPENTPYALVVSGGTSDLPVAEEAAGTLEFLGQRVHRAYDIGVAGIHRMFAHFELLVGAEVIISVAGMEGALTSVVAGLVSCPVIGVPTSVGYGASFEGLAALLAMLNSCANGVAVVNIDNGFGAGVYAHQILDRIRARMPEVT